MKHKSNQQGFSLIELIIVLLVIGILSTMALMAFSGNRKYFADDQARIIIDVFNEARQKALNQRKTFRVEINKTKNELRLIDENTAGVATDDVIIKRILISDQITIGAKPANVVTGPTATSPIPIPVYVSGNYPLSNGDQKMTFRFRRNGQVVDAGTDNIGTGSLITGATIYVYLAGTTNPDVIRAVTLLGTSGDTSFYKCTFDTTGKCGNWSR